jgi:hypothetical protein
MQSVDRLHALDAVRAYALLLGVVLHAAAAFLEDFPIPVWRDRPSTTAAVIYYVIHMFRMSAFFLIAGFFARMVVERRGAGAFVKDRAKRIALPLVAGLPIVMVLMIVGLVLGTLPHGMGVLMELNAQQVAEQQASADAGAALGGFNLVHLWFLYYLLIFYALTLIVRAAVRALDTRGLLASAGDRVVAFLLRGPWGPLLIALPIALYFYALEPWSEWIGLPAPFALMPDVGSIIGYGVPFALGWFLHRQVHLMLDLGKTWLLYLIAAAVLTAVCLTIVGPTPQWQGPNLEGAERIAYTLAYMAGLWCWVFGLVGAALRFLSHESPATRYLADASYWIYIVHMTTILFFLSLLRPYDWHWSIKFAIMVGGSMPILLVSYHYLVRFTWIGAILNGRRHPRPAAPDAAPATS